MITLKNITKNYIMWDNLLKVLKWIDVEILEWDFVSIMWPSGSWKSTLMNIIWMLDIPTSGSYIFDWQELFWKSEDELWAIRGKNIWFIFQSYNLISRMSVIKQVMLPLSYQGIDKLTREKMALEALRKVWLEDKKNHLPNELSWWQQQRVSIARALAINPKFILADEPTGALDSKTWDEIMHLLQELNNQATTIILITHEDEIDAYASKHIHIKDWLLT